MKDVLTVSDEFRQRIVSVWGEEGKAWLDRLPTLITTCAERWGLSVQSPLPNLSYNFVVFATTADGTEAVLKIGVPNPELTTEIDALRAYKSGPVVGLLEADRQLGACWSVQDNEDSWRYLLSCAELLDGMVE